MVIWPALKLVGVFALIAIIEFVLFYVTVTFLCWLGLLPREWIWPDHARRDNKQLREN